MQFKESALNTRCTKKIMELKIIHGMQAGQWTQGMELQRGGMEIYQEGLGPVEELAKVTIAAVHQFSANRTGRDLPKMEKKGSSQTKWKGSAVRPEEKVIRPVDRTPVSKQESSLSHF